MTIGRHSALILEGGGLRGVFTCGVLDYFMDHGITFPLTVGVSAGACNGLSYMSGQRGRAKASNIDLMEKHHYVGLKYLFTQGCIMDFKLLFEDFPTKITPYDYDTYFSNPDRYVMVTTKCLTGQAEYMEERKSVNMKRKNGVNLGEKTNKQNRTPRKCGTISKDLTYLYLESHRRHDRELSRQCI